MRVLSLCLIAIFLFAVDAKQEKDGKSGKTMKSGANPFGVEEFATGMRVMDSDDRKQGDKKTGEKKGDKKGDSANPFGGMRFSSGSDNTANGDKKGGDKKKGEMKKDDKKGDKKGDSANPFGDMRVSSGSVNIELPSMAAAASAASVPAAVTAFPNRIPAAGTILGRASGLNNWQAGSNWGGSYTPFSAAPAAWGALPYARAATTTNWATSNWAAPAAAATTSTWAAPATTSTWTAPATTFAATSNWAAPVSTGFNNWAPATSNWNAAPVTSNWNNNWNAAPATNFNNWGFNGNRFQSFGFGR